MKTPSKARIERRLAKKKFKKENGNMLKHNKCWDELEMLHAASAGLLYSTNNITPILRNEEILSKVDASEMVSISKVIANDLSLYKTKLENIYAKHSGKVGGSDDPDDILTTIMIGQEYIELSDSFQNIVSPNIDKILAMAAKVADIDYKLDTEEDKEIQTEETTSIEEQTQIENVEVKDD